ncbi:MAG: type 1 glutamine amidotransferase [Acidimicrobiia bacterium]
MRALLVANAVDADAGFVGDRFRHHGFAFTECHRESPGEWPSLDGYDLVLTLGSEWSVYWPDVAREVAAETALVRDADERGVPVFGICYGAQLLAHAFGGAVRRSAKPEIGWYDVDSESPDVIAGGPWLQWHYDVVDVPPRATQLAMSAVGPQAYRFDRVFATQFHPEATETMLRRWSAGSGGEELSRLGSSREELLEQTRVAVDQSGPAAARLVDWFLHTTR